MGRVDAVVRDLVVADAVIEQGDDLAARLHRHGDLPIWMVANDVNRLEDHRSTHRALDVLDRRRPQSGLDPRIRARQSARGIETSAGDGVDAVLRRRPGRREHQVFQLPPVTRRILRLQQRHDTGDVRRCHRGAVEELVQVARHGAQDGVAGRGEMHGAETVIREERQRVVGRGDAQQVCKVIRAWEHRHQIDVVRNVSSRGDEQHAACALGGNCLGECG
jgi:hypothetical protein